jgi:transcriptional regulator with XRE-family HTH domain
MKGIGIKINNLMKEHNITQEILADYTNVSQTKIHDIISGKTQKIDFHFMQKICEIFNVDFEYFMDGKSIIKIKKNSGFAVGDHNTINIQTPEGILESMLKRIESIEKRIDFEKGE